MNIRELREKRNVLALEFPLDDGRKIVYTSGATKLGRSSGLEWTLGEKAPVGFDDLKVVITINNANADRVSRHHAGIRQDDCGQFYIFDFSSLGTFVNGDRLLRGQHRILRIGDVITLADQVDVGVETIKDATENNYALLVGHPGHNLRGVKKDLELLRPELAKRGFTIRELYNDQATPENIGRYLDDLRFNMTRGSHLLLHYSGHGSRGGLSLGFFKRYTPKDMYDRLKMLRGKKALILDSCHAGAFIKSARMPERTLVIAGSSEHGYAFENYDWQEGEIVGKFTKALVEHMRDNTGTFNLKDFGRKVKRRFPGSSYMAQEPDYHGENFTVCLCRGSRY